MLARSLSMASILGVGVAIGSVMTLVVHGVSGNMPPARPIVLTTTDPRPAITVVFSSGLVAVLTERSIPARVDPNAVRQLRSANTLAGKANLPSRTGRRATTAAPGRVAGRAAA